MSTLPKSYITPEEYLEIERKAEFKSEYFAGEMFAMAGALWAHNLIVGNVARELGQQLLSRPCAVASNDMRVQVSETGLYTYPDVLVVCGEPQFPDGRQDMVLNPTVLVEVLSPSTEASDRGRKFEHYRTIESFAEYLLVSTDHVNAELLTRQPDGLWLLTTAGSLEKSLELSSIGCRLTLADIYAKVDLTKMRVSGLRPLEH